MREIPDNCNSFNFKGDHSGGIPLRDSLRHSPFKALLTRDSYIAQHLYSNEWSPLLDENHTNLGAQYTNNKSA